LHTERQKPAKSFWLVRAEVNLALESVASFAVAEGMVDSGWGTQGSVTWIAAGERVTLAATDCGVLWILGLPR